MRSYELSKQLGITNKELLQFFKENNFPITSHIATVPEEALEAALKFFSKKQVSKPNKTDQKAEDKEAKKIELKNTEQTKKESPQATQKSTKEESKENKKIEEKLEKKAEPVQEKHVQQKKENTVQHKENNTKINSQTTKSIEPAEYLGSLDNKALHNKPKSHEKIEKSEEAEKIKDIVIPKQSLTVAEFSQKSEIPLSDVIVALLKLGVVATKNQIINKEAVEKLARHFELELSSQESTLAATSNISNISHGFKIESKESDLTERMPVVVVIGHVDHGKTTLLDFIRKTRVASREKGGITQHLGAYVVDVHDKALVFLDTPGHEAFNLIRARGVRSADIAILVVAADDGVMPQTVEAIKHAQLAEVPIIVAINKVDKATPAQIEAVKNQLAQHDLLVEDWGGTTVCALISAKEGTGVSELLEVVDLQSQIMELKANLSVRPVGYILESKLQKGRGSVATVITQHGKLKLGDYFVAGKVSGRISSMTDWKGETLKEAGPSIPVQVAGFNAVPQAGDPFEVVPLGDIKKMLESDFSVNSKSPSLISQAEEGITKVSVILKTDTVSSKEALEGAIKKISNRLKEAVIDVVYSGIGDITERDILLASDTKSFIYGMHVKVSKNLNDLMQRNKVKVKTFDIIYKLLEDLEELTKSEQPIKYKLDKVGEAVVIKTFTVKNIGTIAGALVKSGRFIRNGKVIVWRNKHKVGNAEIQSLQREHKNVKEVHSGFEFAFFTQGYQDWELEDVIECFEEVPE